MSEDWDPLDWNERVAPDAVKEWSRTNKVLDYPDTGSVGPWADWDTTRSQVVLGLWGETRCPRCGEANRPTASLIIPKGFTDNNWEHGCGEWWSPSRRVVDVPDPSAYAEITAALDAALADLKD
jgi:hypothetical protein